MTSLTFTKTLPQNTTYQSYLNIFHAQHDNVKSSTKMNAGTWISDSGTNGFRYCYMINKKGEILMSVDGAPMQVPLKDTTGSPLSMISAYTQTATDDANALKALGGLNCDKVENVYRFEFKNNFVQEENGSSGSLDDENEYLDIIVVDGEIDPLQTTMRTGELTSNLGSIGADHYANVERSGELWLLARLIMWHMVQPCNWSDGAKQFGVWDLNKSSRMKTLATAKANTDSTTDAKVYINDFLTNSGKPFLFERNGVKRRYDLLSILSAIATVIDKEKNERNIFDMAGSGFESTVRLAKSSPEMWTPILEQNKANVIETLDEYIQNLNHFKALMESDDFEAIRREMENTNYIKTILKGIS